MIENILLLLFGFFLLILCSNIFVDALSSIASHFKLPKMLIAITIASFGTCAPELAISFNSILHGAGDIALSNVVGSNVINILLIIGVASLCFPIRVKSNTVKKELPLVLLITTLFSVSMITNFFDGNNSIMLTRIDGLMFLLLFGVFVFYIISIIKLKSNPERSKPKYSKKLSLYFIIACCIGIVYASDLVVGNAKFIAQSLNVSQKVITMTIVVIGTSLPELIMTVISARKKEYDIAVGNIIGTNIFNIGVVLGLPIFMFGGFTASNFNLVDIFAVIVAALILYFSSRNDRVISRREGFLMILVFISYYTYLILT